VSRKRQENDRRFDFLQIGKYRTCKQFKFPLLTGPGFGEEKYVYPNQQREHQKLTLEGGYV